MLPGRVFTQSRTYSLLLGLAAMAIVISIIVFPDQAFEASLQGLKLWWELVFPGLMPFLILTEMLLGSGMIRGLGVLLEPLMRRVFRLPGAGGWALAAGLVGGYPLGADASSKLRKQGIISKQDADRLLAGSHLANPMLIVGVVGAGFLHSPEAGLLLALLHYGSAAAAGLLQRPWKRSASPELVHLPASSSGSSLLTRAAAAMGEAHKQDGRTFGKLLGDAVIASIQTLFMVGGLMMIFSVAFRIISLLASKLSLGGTLLDYIPALLEPHLGAYLFSSGDSWTPALQAALIGAGLAWSGLSLHAQVLSCTAGTDLQYGPFLRFRLLHAGLAFGMTLTLWNPMSRLLQGTETAFSPAAIRLPVTDPGAGWSLGQISTLWTSTLLLMALLLAAMLAMSLMIRVLEKTVSIRPKRS